MKIILEFLIGMLGPMINEAVIHYANKILDAYCIRNIWLFVYCYAVKSFTIGGIITVVVSKFMDYFYNYYSELIGACRCVNDKLLKQTRKSFYLILNVVILIAWFGLFMIYFFTNIKNECETINAIIFIIAIIITAIIYLLKRITKKVNMCLLLRQIVILFVFVIIFNFYNYNGIFAHKNMYYMDDGYIEISLSMERAMHKYKIKTPLGTVMEIPMHIKTFPEYCLFIDLSQIDYIAGIYRLETDIDEPSDFSNTIEIVFRGTEEEKSKYADRYIRLVSRCDEKFAKDNMEKLQKMKSAALNSDTKTFNKYMKSMEIKDPQIEIILNTMRLDKTFNMPFRQ